MVSFLLLSCNKATINLEGFEQVEGVTSDLVGKWELVDMHIDERITNNPNITIEELSEEEAEEGGIRMEFFANGKVITSLMFLDEDGAPQSWDFEDMYTLSADKKTLKIQGEEEAYSIVSLTPTTLTYRGIGEVDFFGEVEKFWASYTFKKIN